MIYQDDEDNWPVDRSGTTIFFLAAIGRLCTELDANWTGHRSLYPDNEPQSDRRSATESDRARAVALLSWHDPNTQVERISLPLNDSIPSFIV